MSKYFAVALFCIIPAITFSQPNNGPELGELYRQIDSLQFSIFRTTDSMQRYNMLCKMKNTQMQTTLEFYRALVRLEANRLSSDDSMLLNISVDTIDSAGTGLTITSIDIRREAHQFLIGDTASVDSLFGDFPRLQKQYREERLVIQPGLRHMKVASPNMDLPSIPKMPNATTVTAKKILADRMLYWMKNACGTLHCENDLASMLEEEKKSNMSIDKIIASRRLFIEYVIYQYSKNKL